MVILLTNNKTNCPNHPYVVHLNKICDLKYICDLHNVIILDNITINEEGVITQFELFFEEILITVVVDVIISNTDSKKLQEISQYYNIPLIIV